LGERPEVHAMTDVTGFGLLGHLAELCLGSELHAQLIFEQLPIIPEALFYLSKGCYPDGAFRNWKSTGHLVAGASSMERMMVLSDPQTSGGLLIACVAGSEAIVSSILLEHGRSGTIIGRMTEKEKLSMITIL
jgi:selenide,water dikinase